LAAVATQTIARRDLRIGATAMLGAALVWPALPVHPPYACPLRTLTGIPCPLCGMTRAVVAAVHGHLTTSLRFNPAGVLVVMLAVAIALGWRAERVHVPKWVLPAALGVLWIYNLTLNPTF
jgi:hypothetical protein